MSQKLVDRSPDLKRLRDEGFNVKVVGTHLLIGDVPYLNANKEVRRGTLVTALELQQVEQRDRTKQPEDHVAWFKGERPCNADGQPVDCLHSEQRKALAPGVDVDFMFSSRPQRGDKRYPDYYWKMVTYVRMLEHQAQAIDPNVHAETFPVVLPDEDEHSVFKYRDTASSRAGIEALSPKLAAEKVAIVGIGGTGSYILDLISKTPIREIHLFDDDRFSQHNAFRCPGALASAELRPDMKKVDHYGAVYSKLRNGVLPHAYRITPENVNDLSGMNFVFLCLDSGEHKDAIMTFLEGAGIAFIDVGMGVQEREQALTGILRVTTSTPARRDHVRANQRVSFAPAIGENDYSRNIQVADLNALNAALAVIKWKKFCGFYHDLEREHHGTYIIETGRLSREDQ